jgi:arabinogalactan endo-1,4-beta-galactosidase
MNKYQPYLLSSYTALLFILLFSYCKRPGFTTSAVAKKMEILGAEASYLPEVRSSGVSLYNSNQQPEDMLATMQKAGINTIRLRLWKNPAEPTSGLASVKALCAELRSKGLKSLITIHYSDSWADPGKQVKPQQWQNANLQQLTDSIYAYTKLAITELQPDYVQIGNEINNGLLWPEGNISNAAGMKQLLKSGVRAVRETNPTTKIVMHYAGTDGAAAFFATIADIDYDIIGISYYPFWHGKDLQNLKDGLIAVSNSYNKPIFIAEASHPFTFQWNDNTNNVIGLSSQIHPDYPATPQGQKDYMLKLKSIIAEVPKGIGFCYWGSEWISYKGKNATDGSTWENQAFWDFNNKALPVLDVYKL